MRFHHDIFKPVHYDHGSTLWSVQHIPFFQTMMSTIDHRRLGRIHNITFYALMKVLTKGKMKKRQAQAMFDLLDIPLTGDLGISEFAFFAAIVVSHKDNMEREFLYMNAWKIWTTFNEHGDDYVSTREFRRTGLFFDFNYPTMYQMFNDFGWDDERDMEFERFRFYLLSCIHFRQSRRFQAKYIRFRQFRKAVLLLMARILKNVLREGIIPSPVMVLKAIKVIKIPPVESMERAKTWMDLLDFNFFRRFVHEKLELVKLYLLRRMSVSERWRCCCSCMCCGLCCWSPIDEHFCGCEDCDVQLAGLYCCRRCSNKHQDFNPDEIVDKPKNKFEGIISLGLHAAQEVDDDGDPHNRYKVPHKLKEVRKMHKRKRKSRLTHEDMVPEVEWRPLGKPKFECGIQ